jgi:NAD(P)-dependent dehydrogenase (short-subunit alcohol dehydrogenase family)
MRLDRRTAWVTGTRKEVGEGIVLVLGRTGCNVGVNYFSDARGPDDTVTELRDLGVEAFPAFGNIGNASDMKTLFAAFDERFRQTDILVNNAGAQTWRWHSDCNE